MQHENFLIFKTNGGVIENAYIYDERDYSSFLFFISFFSSVFQVSIFSCLYGRGTNVAIELYLEICLPLWAVSLKNSAMRSISVISEMLSIQRYIITIVSNRLWRLSQLSSTINPITRYYWKCFKHP